MMCCVKVLSMVRQPLADIIELYCCTVSQSNVGASVDFMSMLTTAIVTDMMQAIQKARYHCSYLL